MNYIFYSFLYFTSFLFLVIGSRFSDGGLEMGLFRSLHAIDLLFPLLLFLAYKNFHLIRKLIPKIVISLGICWIFYSFTFAQCGNLISERIKDPWVLGLGLLFATKELEFLLLFSLGLVVSYRYPKIAFNSFYLILILLTPWTILEFIDPTGFYYIGLPFEKGAIQTGTVYGFLALFILVLINLFSNKLPKRELIFLYFCNLLMIAGMFFSLSRTSLLSFSVGIVALQFFGKTINVKKLIILFFILLIPYIFYPQELSYLWEPISGRWVDASENSLDRFNKWILLLLYLSENTRYILFGAGFGSPNDLVLGSNLGNILAVDSAYVRRLFETGVFGFFIYYSFIASIFIFLYRKANMKPALSLILFFIAAGLTVEASQVTQTSGLFYLGLGTIIGFGYNSCKLS